jgi:hypothetical protein
MPDDAASSDGSGGGGGSEDAGKIESEMDKPADLPTEAVQTLFEGAAVLDALNYGGGGWKVAVAAVIDVVGSILGNHMVARDLAITWGTDTTIRDITHDLKSAKGDVDAYWTDSGAKASFNGYFDSATDALDTAKGKFEEMSSILVEAIRYIYNTYGDAVGFVTTAAGAVSALVPPTTAQGINDLIASVGELVKEGSETVGNFSADATALSDLPSQFTAPNDLPDSIDDSDLWDVEPVD